MDINDIMVLVKAGYTKDEIAQMEKPNNDNPEPIPVVVSEPIAEPEPVQTQVAEPVAVAEPVQKAVPEQNQPTMADIMQGIAKLTSAVQANAIAQSVIPNGLQNPPSAEDMLAEIIRPTFKERN